MPCFCVGLCACAAAATSALLSGGITYFFYDKIKYINNIEACHCNKNMDTDDSVKNYSAIQ
jgi:hypothetical protein